MSGRQLIIYPAVICCFSGYSRKSSKFDISTFDEYTRRGYSGGLQNWILIFEQNIYEMKKNR